MLDLFGGLSFHDWFSGQFTHNQFFIAAISTTVLAGLYIIPKKIFPFFKTIISRRFFVELTVNSSDSIYIFINEWLSDQPYTKYARTLTMNMHETRNRIYSDDDKVKIILSPGFGWHFLLYRGRPVFVEKSIREAGSNDDSKPIETLKIKAFGFSQVVIQNIIADILLKYDNNNKSKIGIYVYMGDHWKNIGYKDKRNEQSLIFEDEKLQRIENDAKWFMENKQWYKDRGIPYNRGYIFYGPPGTGKSSISQILAGIFDKKLYCVNLSSLTSDNRLMSAFSEIPNDAFILIEDMDSTLITNAKSKAKVGKVKSMLIGHQEFDVTENKSFGISLGGFLNVLDGAIASEGRVVIMTTNYIEKIDERILRPGRIDVKEYFGKLGALGISKQFLNFYPDSKDLAKEILTKFKRKMTPAEAQGIFTKYPHDPKKAIADLFKNIK